MCVGWPFILEHGAARSGNVFLKPTVYWGFYYMWLYEALYRENVIKSRYIIFAFHTLCDVKSWECMSHSHLRKLCAWGVLFRDTSAVPRMEEAIRLWRMTSVRFLPCRFRLEHMLVGGSVRSYVCAFWRCRLMWLIIISFLASRLSVPSFFTGLLCAADETLPLQFFFLRRFLNMPCWLFHWWNMEKFCARNGRARSKKVEFQRCPHYERQQCPESSVTCRDLLRDRSSVRVFVEHVSIKIMTKSHQTVTSAATSA